MEEEKQEGGKRKKGEERERQEEEEGKRSRGWEEEGWEEGRKEEERRRGKEYWGRKRVCYEVGKVVGRGGGEGGGGHLCAHTDDCPGFDQFCFVVIGCWLLFGSIYPHITI